MDVPIYLALGLATAGYLKSPNNKKNASKNIYSDGIYDKVTKMEFDKVSKYAEAGYSSGVVPFFFNSLSTSDASGAKLVKNPNYNEKLFHELVSQLKMKKIIKVEHLNAEACENNILLAGNNESVTGTYASNEDTKSSSYSTLVTKNQKIPEIEGKHNNMVPFFGGSVKQNTSIENRQQEDKLEYFTGQFKLDQNHKTETLTMFSPTKEDIFSVDVPRQMDRYSTALTYRNNELPFEQVHVGRGLNDGYTAKPSGGYHNDTRILPKNIDQLVVNPKQTYKGKVIKGKNVVGKRTAEQKVYNYKPKVLVTNENGERNFVTTGERIAQASRPEIILNNVRKNTAPANIGHAKSQNGNKEKMNQTVSLGKDTTLLGAIIGAVQAIGKQMGTQPNAYKVEKTKRAVIQEKNTNNFGYTGQISYNGQIYNNTPVKHLKGESIRTLNPTDGNIGSGTYAGQLVSTDKLKATTKETTEINNSNGYITGGYTEGKVYDPTAEQKHTGRQTIENNTNNGHITGGYIEGKVYDPTVQQKNTGRQTIENNNYNGTVSALQSTGQYVYDPFDFAKNTGRQTIEDSNYRGVISAQVGTGDGYRTAPTNITETQREGYSDSTYTRPAEGQPRPQIYDSAYSMRQNTINEVISKNRENSAQGAKIFNSNVSLTSMPSDKTDANRTPLKYKSTGVQERLDKEYSLSGNKVNDANKYFDTSVLNQLSDNPYNLNILRNVEK